MRVLAIVVMISAVLVGGSVARAQDACVGTPGPVTGTDRVTYSGDGDELIDIGHLSEGVYIVSGTYNGPNYWDVEATGRTTGNIEFVFTLESKVPFDEQTLLKIYDDYVDDYLMEVTASGPWTLSIERA